MARKDDLKLLFDFLIELLKDEKEDTVGKVKIPENKPLLSEQNEQKLNNFDVFDANKIKSLMDKIDSKEHEKAIIKQALNVQAKDYKKEIEELRESFNQKLIKESKLEEDNSISITTPNISGMTRN